MGSVFSIMCVGGASLCTSPHRRNKAALAATHMRLGTFCSFKSRAGCTNSCTQTTVFEGEGCIPSPPWPSTKSCVLDCVRCPAQNVSFYLLRHSVAFSELLNSAVHLARHPQQRLDIQEP